MKVCHKVVFLFRLLAVVVRCSGAESLMWGVWEILLDSSKISDYGFWTEWHTSTCYSVPLQTSNLPTRLTHCLCSLRSGVAAQLPAWAWKSLLSSRRKASCNKGSLFGSNLAHLTTRRKAKTYSILEEVKAVISQHG